MILEFHPEFFDDLEGAARYYDQQETGLGVELTKVGVYRGARHPRAGKERR